MAKVAMLGVDISHRPLSLRTLCTSSRNFLGYLTCSISSVEITRSKVSFLKGRHSALPHVVGQPLIMSNVMYLQFFILYWIPPDPMSSMRPDSGISDSITSIRNFTCSGHKSFKLMIFKKSLVPSFVVILWYFQGEGISRRIEQKEVNKLFQKALHDSRRF